MILINKHTCFLSDKLFIEGQYTYEDNDYILKDILLYLVNEELEKSEDFEKEDFVKLNAVISILEEEISDLPEKKMKSLEKLKTVLENWFEAEDLEHPRDLFLNYLYKNKPKFVYFDNESRFLKGNYSKKEIEGRPAVLENLLKVSDVNIESVLGVLNSQNTSQRLVLTEKVNASLKKVYSESWTQSEVYPQILFDPTSINIQIKYLNSYTEINERSDGLKQYIALRAFLANQDFKTKPILLIDEAEIHLHYSAQSDLVTEFEKQSLVKSIIYTTHSSGCLPSDLGTGIRVIKPIYESGVDTGKSIILNSIWSNTGGFSPILFAMGANIIMFTPARKGVIAEGPSEVILLPRLLREANSIDTIEFQVAPGIANISKDQAKMFELEAAMIAYLVDGDEGGNKNKKKLVSGGVELSKIVLLPQGHSLEDLVDSQILIDGINTELRKSGLKLLNVNIENVPKCGKIKWLELECKKNKIKFPNKVRIAESISNTESDILIIDNTKVDVIKKTYSDLNKVLNI